MASFRTGIHWKTELYVNERKTKCLLKGNFQRWTEIQEKNISKNKNNEMKNQYLLRIRYMLEQNIRK